MSLTKASKRRPAKQFIGLTGAFKHYVYRHIRLDKNQPFYIGLGTVQNCSSPFTRARSRKERNPYWVRIADKTDYRVEIIYESDDYKSINKKEVEFISLYGRVNNGTGILSNLTDGGEGTVNVVTSNEKKQVLREHNLGLKASDETKRKMSESQQRRHDMFGTAVTAAKEVYQYGLNGNYIRRWASYSEVQNELGISHSKVGKACTSENHYGLHYYWYNTYQGNTVPTYKILLKKYPIEQVDNLGNVLNIFSSAKDASNKLFGDSTHIGSIGLVCKGRYTNHLNLKFRYVTQ